MVVLLVLLAPLEMSRRSGIIVNHTPMRALSDMVGWLSLSLLLLAVAAALRIPGVIADLGLHPVMRVHVVFGMLAAAAAVAHLVLVVLTKPADLRLLILTQAPPRAIAAVAATLALLLIVWLSLRRSKAHAHYEQWRAVHGLLAVAALVGALLHVILLEHLIRNDGIAVMVIGAGTAITGGLFALWVLRPMAAAQRPYRLAERAVEGGLVRLTFTPARGRSVPRYAAGQFFRIRAVHGPPEFHPFTVAGAAQEHPRVSFAIADNGDYSRRLRRLAVGAQVLLDGPYGAMTRKPGEGPTLMLVAGAGIAPALSILRTAARRRDRDRHTVVLSARAPEALPFLGVLDALRRRLRLDVVVTVTQPSTHWRGESGRVDAAMLRRHGVVDGLPRRVVYICGPDGFVASMEELVLRLGADPDRLRSERFDGV